MSALVTNGGEVTETPAAEQKAALHSARSQLAAFKFSLFETVAADPRLKSAPCTDLIIVYARFVTIDDDGRRTQAFATNNTINARAGIKCHKTAKRARDLLERHGYMVPIASRNGVTIYDIANPNSEKVAEHVAAAAENLREAGAIKKANERQRAVAKAARVGEMPAPHALQGVGETPDLKSAEGGRNSRDRVGETPGQGWEKCPPITLEDTIEVNLRDSSAYEDGGKGTYTQDGLAQRGTQSVVASKPVETAPSSFVGEKKKNTAQYAQAREVSAAPAPSFPPKPNSYLSAKQGRSIGREPFPAPRNEEAGRAFLRNHHVPESEWGRLLPSLMAGELWPFDIEPWMDAA